LLAEPTQLDILGDGKQSKSYIHVEDVIDAVLTAHRAPGSAFRVFNVATGDYITVTEIAELAMECLGLRQDSVRLTYRGGDRGWKGDVPIVRLSIDLIRSLGWRCRRSSRAALGGAMRSMIEDFRAWSACDAPRGLSRSRRRVNRAYMVGGFPIRPPR